MVIGPFRGPARRPANRARPIGISPAFVSDISAFDISWHGSGLSEPIQIEPGLSAAWTAYTSGASLPQIFPGSWHQQLATPQWKRVFLTAEHPFFVTDYSHPTPQADSWHQALTEPQRRRDIPQSNQPWDFTMDWKWSAPTPSTVPAFFYSWLSEPVQIEPGLSAAWTAYSVGASLPTIFADSWHVALADPIQIETGLGAQHMQVSAVGPGVTVTVPAFFYSWLSDPVRRADTPQLRPWDFSMDAKWISPTPAITDLRNYWFNPLAEPVRRKDMPTADQPWNFTIDWSHPTPQADSWHMQLATPRWTRTLPIADYPFLAIDTRTPATPSQIPAWYNFLSEPVRQKPGLIPAAQQFYTMDWKWAAPTPVTFSYSFSLIEMGDRGIFNFFEGAVAAGAKVGIEEIRVGTSANVGISEIISP